MFVAAYEQEHKIEDMEYVLYSNVESDYEDDDEYPKQRHNPRGHKPLLKPASRDGNLHNFTAREDNVHDLASPGTRILTQNFFQCPTY